MNRQAPLIYYWVNNDGFGTIRSARVAIHVMTTVVNWGLPTLGGKAKCIPSLSKIKLDYNE